MQQPNFYNNLNSYQQQLVDKMLAGNYNYTFGPGSPNATYEDRNTYVGGRYSPAGGFAVNGGYALAPQDYYSFTPAQRHALGIMDIGPRAHQGLLERYFSSAARGGRNMFQGARNKIGNFFGGGQVTSGPFQGWTKEAMNQWHNGPGYEQVQDPSTGNPYFGINPGGTQGGPTMDPTNWVNVPGIGNVPMAILANPQASTSTSDYVNNQPGGLQVTNGLGYNPSAPYGSSGSGVPTQRGVGALAGAAGGILGNLLLPGLGGLVLGKLGGIGGRMLTRYLQQQHPGGRQPGAPAPVPGAPVDPQASDPVGGGAYPPGYLKAWFGKGQGGEFGRTGDPSTPADFGNNSSNWGSNTTSFVGGGGNPNLPVGGSYFGGAGSLSVPGGGSLGPLGGSGGMVGGGIGNAMANTALRHLLKFGMPTISGSSPGPNYQFGNNIMGGHVSSPGFEFGRNILLRRGISGLGGGNFGNNTGRGIKGES